jgi:uncharacterized protein YndB with AHSA1/START domain
MNETHPRTTPTTGSSQPDPRRLHVESTIEVAAPFDLVWRLASDIHRYPEWVDATGVILDGDPVAGPGATYVERGVPPMKLRSSWVVVEADREKGVHVHRSDDMPGMSPAFVTMRIEPTATGATFTCQLTVHPRLRMLVPLLRPMLDRSNRKTVEAFAALAEQAASKSGIPSSP